MLAHTQKITGFQKFHLKNNNPKTPNKQKTEETIKSTKQLSTWN